ncbi:hypothetical protein, partial [Zavarzinella formosa]|uniref:hypothetical protein n=1 Tax=Zavarzinella formosa TaxID=360055 RepID=UPI00187D8A66
HLRRTNHDAASPEWAEERRKLERFHLLWNWAERLKIFLSGMTAQVPKVSVEEALPDGFSRFQDVMKKLLEGRPPTAAAAERPGGAA